MKNKKTGILSVLAILMAANLNAQNLLERYEIGLCGSAGLSALHFTTADGSKPSYSAGYAFGMDIAVLFAERWAFRTGVNMSAYHASVAFGKLETRTQIPSPLELPDGMTTEYDQFYLITEYSGYEELHKAIYLRFPLMVQYQMKADAKRNFYVAAGLQVGIGANTVYMLRSDDVVTKGYSDHTMQYYEFQDFSEYGEDFSKHGLDKYENVKSMNKSDFGLVLSGALETGLRWKLRNEMALYTGIFLDYSFNDVRRDSPTNGSINYDDKGAHTFNSFLQSQSDGTPMTGKIHPLAVGLRLRWSMLFKK